MATPACLLPLPHKYRRGTLYTNIMLTQLPGVKALIREKFELKIEVCWELPRTVIKAKPQQLHISH